MALARQRNATPPGERPGVALAVNRLDRELRRLLGAGTVYCLVIAQDTDDVVNIQAMTNASPTLAHQLLRAADETGFDSLN